MKGVTLTCKFCGEVTRIHHFTEQDIASLCAMYVTHLVESHWDVLKKGRAMRVATGVPVNDAWTRL